MEWWSKLATEFTVTVIAGVFAPPVIAAILLLGRTTRAWLKKPWLVSVLTTTFIATIVSVVFWTLIGGLSFSDVGSIKEVGVLNSTDLLNAHWQTIQNTKDEVKVKYICYASFEI